MKNILPVILLGMFLAGSTLTSCKKHLTEPPTDTTHKKCDTCNVDTSHHPCDTCNLNQDSLQRIRDSLAHAFTWKEFTIPSETNLTGVWVFGPNDIYVVGGTVYHFDGTTFTDMQPRRNGTTGSISLDGALSGNNFFAFSKTDFWLVYAGIALHTTDGKYFDDYRFGPVNACWGMNSNDMFFVGSSGHIYHDDGKQFTQMNSGTTKDLNSVWGINHNDVWACGANTTTGETTILHFDGNNWQEDPLAKTNSALHSGLFATWACDSAGHSFVTSSGSNIYRKTDNGSWRNDTSLVPNNLGGNSFVGLYLLSGNYADDFIAAGGWGWVGHWNGKSWKRYDVLFNYGNSDYNSNALSLRGNTACVVGEKSGQSWMAVGTRK